MFHVPSKTCQSISDRLLERGAFGQAENFEAYSPLSFCSFDFERFNHVVSFPHPRSRQMIRGVRQWMGSLFCISRIFVAFRFDFSPGPGGIRSVSYEYFVATARIV
jgi:hypothetical protein